MTSASYFAGKLLVAMPAIGDPRFDHMVVALASHDAGGALGIVVSRDSDNVVSDLLADTDLPAALSPDPPILWGGPVEPDRGFVLHSPDWEGEGTLDSGGPFRLTASMDVLRAIAAGEGPADWHVAMGYAGWGAGQLEQEIAHHAWHVTHCHASILFGTPPGHRWEAALRRDGIDPARLVQQGGTA